MDTPQRRHLSASDTAQAWIRTIHLPDLRHIPPHYNGLFTLLYRFQLQREFQIRAASIARQAATEALAAAAARGGENAGAHTSGTLNIPSRGGSRNAGAGRISPTLTRSTELEETDLSLPGQAH